MQIPSADPAGYCRLCFTQQQLRWLLQSSDDPMVAQIQSGLGVALTPEEDFPCSICRMCSAALETLEALRERAWVCDAVLRESRQVGGPPSVNFEVVECKQECASPEPEVLSVELVRAEEDVVQEEPNGNADDLLSSSNNATEDGSSNTIMVGDIKVKLLNVRSSSEGNSSRSSIMTQSIEKPNKFRQSYVCPVCKQRFVSGSNLQKHIHVKHSSKHDSAAKAAAAVVATKRLRPNGSAEWKPISPKDIRKQLGMSSFKSPNPTNYTVYTCDKCNAQFCQWPVFLRHKRIHDNGDGAGQAGSNPRNVSSS